MATDSTAKQRPRVLVQFAGNQHNDPSKGDHRPGLRIARMRELAPLAHVYVLHTDGDEVAKRHALALAEDLGKGKRGGLKVSVKPVGAGTPPDPTRRERVREPIEALVETLARTELGSRFADIDFVVSTANGTAAQWSCLIDALDARGARLSLVWRRFDDTLSVWRGTDEARGVEPEIAMLERAPAAWNVLLTGPTGAGKTATATRLHEGWKRELRREGAFVSLNVSALPRELVATELFGHVKGAFTHASSARAGAFRKAHGGTLFLDEIGDLPLDLQVQLLTALDVDGRTRERTVTPVGADRSERVDVRLVFGTNRDLHAMASDSRFRLDLLGRISTHHLTLPPLSIVRHRIVGAYLRNLDELAAHYTGQGARPVQFTLSDQARRRLFDFALAPSSAWPWNHRDVQQSAERLAMRAWHDGASRTESAASKGDRAKPRLITVTLDHLDVEIAELEGRWRSLARDTVDDGWADVAARLRPGEWEKLSQVERWELRYLLEARDASTSNADAWRHLVAGNLVEGARDASVRNPTNAFVKRWARYEKRLLPQR